MSADSPARQRILDAAFRLFYARGIRAVGVDTIIAESGVAKATFYKHFPAKDDLVVAYLDRVDGVWFGQLRSAFINAAAESQPGTPVHERTVAHKDRVLAWVTGLSEAAGAHDPERLARTLTLLLDGGLASGALDASPEAPRAARAAAEALVGQALAERSVA
jgi:AcrR family transcriptional regulator